MSGTQPYEVERWAVAQSVGESLGKLLLILMAIDANAQGYAWTSQRVLAERAECTRQTVNEWFRRLEHRGLIATRPRKRGNGGTTSKGFVLLFKHGLTWPDGTPAPLSDRLSAQRTPPVGPADTPLSAQPTPPCQARPDTQKRKKEETREEKRTKTPTTTTMREPEHERQVALSRLERWVDAKLQHGLGKPEFRDEDLAKTDWLEDFLTLSSRTDEEFESALAAMVLPTRLKDPQWRKRLGQARSAKLFVAEFDKLATASPSPNDNPLERMK